jgi:hypothetical protein
VVLDGLYSSDNAEDRKASMRVWLDLLIVGLTVALGVMLLEAMENPPPQTQIVFECPPTYQYLVADGVHQCVGHADNVTYIISGRRVTSAIEPEK